MKRVAKRILYGAITFICVVIIYGLLLAHPEPLFAHSLKVRNFTYYSNSPIDPRISELTDQVNGKLARSEIFDQSIQFRVFVVGNENLYAFFNGPYRRAIARNYEIGNSIFIPTLDVAHGRIVHFDGRSADAANIIAHEAVHTLMQHRLGLYQVLKLPWWKREGYAEYIASDLGRWSESPPQYQEAMRKYICLMETAHLNFDKIVAGKQSDAVETACP